MHIAGAETRKCPPEFQARLTKKFGRNQFGDPHFKIVWNQSQFIRLAREDKRGHYYRDCYQGDGNPCWMIMRWKPASQYGSPVTYYANTWIPTKTAGEDSMEKGVEVVTRLANGAVIVKDAQGYDSFDGFYVTAEYPYKGRYEIVQPLIHKEFVDGKLVLTHLPLSHYLIDVIIPLLVAWQSLSIEEREVAKRAEEEAEQKRLGQQIEDMMMDLLPAWYGPVSFSRQGCKTSLLARKEHEIQQQWNRLARHGRTPQFQHGIAQGDRPMISGYR